MCEPFQVKLSRPRLVDGNRTQDNNKKKNKNGTRRQELKLPGDWEYKMPKTGVDFLSRFDFLITYRLGAQQGKVDALSR